MFLYLNTSSRDGWTNGFVHIYRLDNFERLVSAWRDIILQQSEDSEVVKNEHFEKLKRKIQKKVFIFCKLSVYSANILKQVTNY